MGLFFDEKPLEIEKVWLKPNYLPYLKEAEEFNIEVMSLNDLRESFENRDILFFDIECYSNYFLASFMSKRTGKVLFFEKKEDTNLDIKYLKWIIENFETIGFNSINYDIPMVIMALNGLSTFKLKQISDDIIVNEIRHWEIFKRYKVESLYINHIDLIEVAPLKASLKIYGGRLHSEKMQDLPFDPNVELTEDQIKVVRWYNLNSDLPSTAALHKCLEKEIKLREEMSVEIKKDLRSKSDAQIAESVISTEFLNRTGIKPEKIYIRPGTSYRYNKPNYIKFKTKLLNSLLERIEKADFIVAESGSIKMPESIDGLLITIADTTYRIGIGGIHSTESCVKHSADEEHFLIDKDVASYYPFILLNVGLAPKSLGNTFLDIFRGIVDRRIKAKREGNKTVADSLKITINGAFGKLGNKYSILYAPDLLFHVTITGQLSLLMLIEELELNGISVKSANTDGIIIKCKKSEYEKLELLSSTWEEITGFQLENTFYDNLYSRDVNNYIACSDKFKLKGTYSTPWLNGVSPLCLHKNPVNIICMESVLEFLKNKTPIETTILNSKDIRKFITVRTVKGGAIKIDNKKTEYLGKAIRWYYSTKTRSPIYYAQSGNKVPRSEGAAPCMVIPSEFPEDIDFKWYIAEAENILKDVGYFS
jgi:hypothetical protein